MNGFSGFSEKDFDVFSIEGLENRMEALRFRLSPKLEEIAYELQPAISAETGEEMYVHVAKHARRSKNPPNDTWAAIANNKRGYKKLPHFQIGLWGNNVFLWLAFIYELPDKERIAEAFLEDSDFLKSEIPDHYVLSKDHTKNEAFAYNAENLSETLHRFRDVKKGEFLVGRRFSSDDDLLKDGNAFINEAQKTFETLLPLYKKAMNI